MTTTTQSTAFETALVQALALHQSGALREALQAYERLRPTQPQHAQLLYLIGAAQLQLGQLEASIQNTADALAIAPKYLAAWKNLAHTFMHLNRVNDALTCFEQVIALSPQDANAHFQRANLLSTLKRFDEAVASYAQAIAQQPNDALAWNNCGLALKEQGRWDEALTHYDTAISLRSDLAHAHYSKGIVLKLLKRFDQALSSYDAAIAIKPDYVDAHLNRGNLLHALKRETEALTCYDIVIALSPTNALVYNNRGVVLQACERMDDALESYNTAISLNPNEADAYNNRGNVFFEKKHLNEALASYAQAIAIDPRFAAAHNNRGNALREAKRWEEALQSYDMAIAIRGDHVQTYQFKGLTLKDLNRFDEALACCTQAIAMEPDDACGYTNHGLVLQACGRLPEALACYDQAMVIDPHDAIACWSKSMALLLLGEFDKGWPLYEWRWEQSNIRRLVRNFKQPLWLGQASLAGKTVLLHAEQGLGDSIQFCRYAKLVRDLGATVLLEIPQPLLALFDGLTGVSALIEKGATLPDFDYHCPLLSLPLAFKTDLSNIPSPTPYLSSQTSKVTTWQQRLGPPTKPRVGLVWSGNLEHKNDHFRSVPLADIWPHLPPEFDYVSLQKVVRDVDQAAVQSSGLRHFGDELHDFSDTAALCELMDVVISVDTSVAHLAAAIGRPTWIMLPDAPDWRWLLDREDSPWYECVKLYRQGVDRRWDTVVQQFATDLRQTL